MNAILSVNCVYVTALSRIKGPQLFAFVLNDLYNTFVQVHQNIEQDTSKSKIKNILNCLLHFFLFKSMTAQLLIDFIKLLLNSFNEADIEILIFILHNIGLQLRKEDPV